jgi:hypothetical protein
VTIHFFLYLILGLYLVPALSLLLWLHPGRKSFMSCTKTALCWPLVLYLVLSGKLRIQ